MVEAEAEDGIAGLEQRVVGGLVRRPTSVRLDVRMVGPEQLLGAVDRQLLDLVDELAAAVVPAPG